MAKSEELDWLMGPPQLKFGDIKEKIWDYVSPGDTIYITGMIEVDSNFGEGIYLENEPVTVTIKDELKSYNKRYFYITVGKNITDTQIWYDNISGDELDIGSVASDDELLITLPNKSINESNEFDWIRDIPSNQKVKPWNGTIGYPTADKTSPKYGRVYLYTDDGGVTREIKVGGLMAKHRSKNYKGEWFGSDGEVRFYDASIMDSEIESKNYDPEYPDPYENKYQITMSRQEYNDNARKGKLILTPNDNSIIESEEDFDWTDDFQWTTDMLYSMLENCNEIKISNYSLKYDTAYKAMGGPVIYTLTRCKEWWDRFSTIELDDSGRGPAEWYDDYDEGRIGLISAYGTKNKNIRDIDWEDIYNHEGWTISQEPYQIVNSLNGKGSELFILLDDKGRPVYDLIPKEHRERIKTNWEDRFYGKNINESDEDPLKWIKDVKTNQDFAKEIYNGLKWHKEGVLDIVRTQWIDIPFLVTPTNISKHGAKITPGVFYRGFVKYVSNTWGIHEMEDLKEIYWLVRGLIGQKINNNLNESELDWLQNMGENKKPINEAAGISFEARKWGEIIYNEIINNPDEKKRLIIDGYDHPEAFNGFPIDYVVIDFYDRLTGYGQEHSGYDKDGNYVVLLYIQPKLLQGQGGYNLKSVLNHEMKHAWEDYNRLSKGLPSIEHTKESQELYNRDFILMLSDQNITGPIKEILKYYYYLSNLEKSAYLENVYDQNPTYERVVRDITSKDFESFKDRFDLDVNWHLMNTAYDIPFLKKFKSPREFIDYSAEELRSKAVKITKKINKMRYIHGK